MSAPDLKPCPFCGGEAEIWRAHRGLTAWIACMGRCAVLVSKEYTADEEAIAAWNTRAPLAEAQIEAALKKGMRIATFVPIEQVQAAFDAARASLSAAPAGHWKDVCRESNGPEICDEPCSKCLRAIGGDA